MSIVERAVRLIGGVLVVAVALAVVLFVALVLRYRSPGPAVADAARLAAISEDALLMAVPTGGQGTVSESRVGRKGASKTLDNPSGLTFGSLIRQEVTTDLQASDALAHYVDALERTGWELRSVDCSEDGGYLIRSRKLRDGYTTTAKIEIPALLPVGSIRLYVAAPHHEKPAQIPSATGYGCALYLGLTTAARPEAVDTIYSRTVGAEKVLPGAVVVEDDIIVTNRTDTTRTVRIAAYSETWAPPTIEPSQLVLEPGEWQLVTLTVRAPSEDRARETIRVVFAGLTPNPLERQYGYEVAAPRP